MKITTKRLNEIISDAAFHDGSDVPPPNLNEVHAISRELLAIREVLGGNHSEHPLDMVTSQQIEELVMMVKRLLRSLKKADPDNWLSKYAMQYLNDRGLIHVTDCLRGNYDSNTTPE